MVMYATATVDTLASHNTNHADDPDPVQMTIPELFCFWRREPSTDTSKYDVLHMHTPIRPQHLPYHPLDG